MATFLGTHEFARAGESASPKSDAVLRLDFERFGVGEFTDIAARAGWAHNPQLTRRANVVRDGDGRVLRVAYPAGRVGSKESGTVFIVAAPPAVEYYLSYRIKLDESFDFRNGGKLPGLSSEGCSYSGGRIPARGDGWSARLAWGPGGELGVYLYHASMKGPWGDVLRLSGPLTKGHWHRIVQHVRLNSGERANGVLEVWLDGALELERHDVTYRVGGKGPIEALCFSTFHGGSDPEKYGPHTTGYAFFDDFLIGSRPPSHVRPSPRSH